MSFDSISSSSIPAASKRGNKSAKLEQDKPDVRNQQWLSQVKNQGCKEESSRGGKMHEATRTLEITRTNGETDGKMHNDNDSDPWLYSPSSHTGSVVESNCSGSNFSGSSNGTFYLRIISDVEDGGGLDDWEALADALEAIDEKKDQRDHKIESLVEIENVIQLDHLPQVVKQPMVAATVDVSKQKPEKRHQRFKSGVENKKVTKLDRLPEVVNQLTATVDFWKPKPENRQAGRRGDAFRGKPKPEKGQAWRNRGAFNWKPNSENGQEWRNCDPSNWKPKPENGQAWMNRDAFHWKPKPENGQAWRHGDAFCWKPKPEKRDQKSISLVENKNVTQLDHLPEAVNQPTATMDVLKPKPENGQATVDVLKPKPENGQATMDVLKPKPENGQAQSHGDAFLPKTLPSLQEKHNYPMKANRHYHHGGTTLGCKNFVSPPSSCPICCEDLDSTDSSFLPCSCEFQLCLFCHKRILEEDGRCPGCRKPYDNKVVQWEENSDLIVA